MIAGAAAFALLAATTPGARALSVSSASATAAPTAATGEARTTLVDRAMTIRELRNEGDGPSRRARQILSMDARPLLDGDALSAALFDDGFNNSLESAVANSLKGGKKGKKKNVVEAKSASKIRAEEFDRFMEEDATVASMVQESIRPGSLVDAVQRSRGSDVSDTEALLQREAMDRRKRREVVVVAGGTTKVGSAELSSPAIKVTRRTKLASKARAPPSESDGRSERPALLTRDQEYALAHTIQAGARVHKLKAERESAHSQPLSKKDWAKLAGMSANDLRKLISDYRTAKQELVSSNMGLVRAVVRSHARRAKYRGVPLEELIQEGSLGLIRAAELFDPAKGLRFSTYATIWIKGVLSNTDPLGEVIRVPSRERALWNKVRAAWAEVASNGGTGPGGRPPIGSAGEIAAKLGMEQSAVEDHLTRMSRASNVLSLDYQYASTSRSGQAGDGDRQEALMNTSRFGTDADVAEQAQFRADLVAGLARNLSEKEGTLMRLRYGLEDGKERSIKECAELMGINRETARLLQHACLRKLREASSMESLQEYLLTVA